MTASNATRAALGWIFGEIDREEVAMRTPNGTEITLAATYDGAPEWLDGEDLEAAGEDCFTAIYCSLYAEPLPETLQDRNGRTWKLVGSYSSSGERDCPLVGDPIDAGNCAACDASAGEKHGCVYIGDGWAEYVYRAADDLEEDP